MGGKYIFLVFEQWLQIFQNDWPPTLTFFLNIPPPPPRIFDRAYVRTKCIWNNAEPGGNSNDIILHSLSKNQFSDDRCIKFRYFFANGKVFILVPEVTVSAKTTLTRIVIFRATPGYPLTVFSLQIVLNDLPQVLKKKTHLLKYPL